VNLAVLVGDATNHEETKPEVMPGIVLWGGDVVHKVGKLGKVGCYTKVRAVKPPKLSGWGPGHRKP
jgi:hypothetical protein